MVGSQSKMDSSSETTLQYLKQEADLLQKMQVVIAATLGDLKDQEATLTSYLNRELFLDHLKIVLT